ncbi:DUF167 domain-containing protein [Calothrix sp. PCC 6303]|uniref:DUF167 domain-containing protein n=1 Tax=Calothrix sp. PCC 6303 TaxID=1170562 RepID=UPI0002A033F4|nr:DUF167 domain-containing protein [Calothrix sp. PCC 6303]AFZ03246.1 UPF0235 protein yggU [Calothrix sp. PCC 6303]
MQKITVVVKPNSHRQKIEELEDGSLKVYLKSSPVDGKANKELIQVLADRYNVPKSHILIKLGLASRQKVVEIDL